MRRNKRSHVKRRKINWSITEVVTNAQNYDTEVSQALEAILKNGPRSLTKGLEDWNLEVMKCAIAESYTHIGQVQIDKGEVRDRA